MFRNRSASTHSFAMVPRAEIPRASFNMQKTYKTTLDAGYLVPIFVEEVLPGDAFRVSATAFARLATPLFPVMDNLHLDSFFFFVPNRLVWTNWPKFMGEQNNPADSISYVVPQLVSPTGGYVRNTLGDYFGLPTSGQVGGGATVSHSALPFRAYNLIFNEWFRDQNLQDSAAETFGDGPDAQSSYALQRRGKRHDYFTSALPWPQKGGTSVTIPLGTVAPVKAGLTDYVTGAQSAGLLMRKTSDGTVAGQFQTSFNGTGYMTTTATAAPAPTTALYPGNLYADLSAATAASINQLRQSFQIQKLLERDARGGTRYTELIRSHFGVMSPDARLQRPEYLGGSHSLININPIAQTSATGLTGGTTPVGSLAAMGTGVHKSAFSQAFTEHGYIIGLVNVRADLTYQQGIRRHWTRSTRYDYYFPVFAMLGEQTILTKEIYCDGSANDNVVFGYQERWAEYRYLPNEITGLFRSTFSGTLDAWHFAQRFTSAPVLNSTFIQETPPLSRNLAVGAGANGAQLLLDVFFDIRAARPMPLYSVPGLIDHF